MANYRGVKLNEETQITAEITQTPNFTSHTRCMISAILYSFVYYNFARAEAHQSNVDDRYLSSIRGQPIKILRHQSAGRSNRCMKQCSLSFSSSSDARATYGSRLRILRWHTDVVSSSSFRVSLRIFEQKRDCSQSSLLSGNPKMRNPGCFPLCQRFRKFRSEFKWKGSFWFF